MEPEVMATTVHEPLQSETPHQPGQSGGGGFRNLAPVDGNLHAVEDRSVGPSQTGIWVALGAITMSFAALTSALVVREGTGMDWQHIALPRMLFVNTLVLVASSVTLEIARRRVAAYARGTETQLAAPLSWLMVTLGLGILFVAGQYVAWLHLKGEGLYLATNPNSSFFYLFTGVHAVHVLGGLAGLIYVMSKLRRSILRRSTFAAMAQYWHFIGLLWLYLLGLLWTKL
jgi:cytochrome c oxidase subunit III